LRPISFWQDEVGGEDDACQSDMVTAACRGYMRATVVGRLLDLGTLDRRYLQEMGPQKVHNARAMPIHGLLRRKCFRMKNRCTCCGKRNAKMQQASSLASSSQACLSIQSVCRRQSKTRNDALCCEQLHAAMKTCIKYASNEHHLQNLPCRMGSGTFALPQEAVVSENIQFSLQMGYALVSESMGHSELEKNTCTYHWRL